ncbi:MAG: DUF166 family protein [Archaeoglobaceae archaeon]|nr:hypothetical protein [Archaeoglobaceae archaeon]MDW7989985.1 DUF166 family protein [Archaeoglobaceae archaeon]
MDLAIIYSGKFGERFLCNIAFPRLCPQFGACGIEFCDFCKEYDFSSKISSVIKLPEPSFLGLCVENPENFIPNFSCDILIAINVHPDILISLPKLVNFNALIVPACDQRWCSLGLRKQISDICSEIGVEFASPKPFCSLLPKGKIISKFCKSFKIGRPEFDIEVDGDSITKVKVLRSDPCGSAYYVAKKMRGYTIGKSDELYKEIHQHQCAYPCMASMERDIELKEAPFHLAGYIMVYNFCRALGIDAKSFVPEHFRKIVLNSE